MAILGMEDQDSRVGFADEDRNVGTFLDDDEFVPVNEAQRTKTSRHVYGLFTKYMGSEAATTFRNVTGLDGGEAWSRLHASYNRRTLGIMFRVQRRVDVSQNSEGRRSSEGSDYAAGRTLEEHELCPKDVQKQMLMRLDEIGENYEYLKTNLVSYSTSKDEQSRLGQVDTSGPVYVDNVTCSEDDDEAGRTWTKSGTTLNVATVD